MRHNAETPSVALGLRKTNPSHALAEARIYRPGPLLAACVLLAPPLLAFVGAGVSLQIIGRIPIWLPLILLLWLPLLPVAWLTMISVRTSASGIAVARPWRHWSEIRWTLVEHVERRGPRIVLHSSDGRSARFYPLTLHDGARLRRELLMRLPIHVLDVRLRSDARELLGEPIGARGQGLIPGPLEVHPRRVWSLGLVTLLVGAAAGGWIALLALPRPLAVVVVIVAALVAVLCALALPLLTQRVALTDAGIAVTGMLGRRVGHLAWDEIQLVERTRHERVLRLRGERRLRCPGPALLAATEGEIFRAYLQTYCFERGALEIVRRWL